MRQRLTLQRSLFGSVLAVALLLSSCGGSDDEPDVAPAIEDGTSDELVAGAGEAVEPADDPVTTTTSTSTTTTTTVPEPSTAEEAAAALGRGINFGNSLEAPREGDWGVGLDESYFRIIADAGFDNVRLPVSWAGYADIDAPYTIPDGVDPTIDHPDYTSIWERVDWAIDQAEQNDLQIIVNVHHYDGIHADPSAEEERFLAIWEQIASHYEDAGDHVYFELLNEPNTAFDAEPELWNDLATKALAVVREKHPTRPVLIGPVGYNAIDRLGDLQLPDDPNIIATVHVYEPFDFTHQGATWIDPVRPLGTRWEGDAPVLPLGVYDYSWDTTAQPDGSQVRVAYERQWAGFSFDYQRGIAPTSMFIAVTGEAEIRVLCRTPDGDLDVTSFYPEAAERTYDVDLSGCPGETTGVSLQNAGTDGTELLFDSLIICTSRGCEEMLQTAGGALDGLLEQAETWAAEAGVPMYVGEFGSFGADGQVPLTDRAAWTSAAAEAATSRGMSFAYWEFHAGFGAYDLTSDDWIPELRDALLG